MSIKHDGFVDPTVAEAYDSWLEWFYINADFGPGNAGPSHKEIMIQMYKQFVNETGLRVPQVEQDYE
jgi:hypothetical protein